MCDSAKESCPILPKSTKVLHRNIDDPSKAQDKLTAFRKAILDLKKYAEELDIIIRS